MTKKDFFRILIKVFGLYSILTSLFSVLPSNISFVLTNPDMNGFIWLFVAMTIILALFYFLLKRPDIIINILKLDKGFDEDHIHFEKLNNQNIIKLSSIIIGGLLIIDNIPAFLSHTLFAFQTSLDHSYELSFQDKVYWATSFIKIVLGYFLVTNYNKTARLLKTED